MRTTSSYASMAMTRSPGRMAAGQISAYSTTYTGMIRTYVGSRSRMVDIGLGAERRKKVTS